MIKKIQEEIEELGKYPNFKWKKFFERACEINTLEIINWKKEHLLFYFAKKYKDIYSKEYSWKYNTPSPSKSFEVWQIKTLGAKLSADPKILRAYIDWVYAEKAIKEKRRFTSISFITKDEYVNEYKWNELPSNKAALHLDRSSPLPIEYIEIYKKQGFLFQTYGDAAFTHQANWCNNESDKEIIDKLKICSNELIAIGFDIGILQGII